MKLRSTLLAAALTVMSALALIVLPGSPAQAIAQCSTDLAENSNGNISVFLLVPAASSGSHTCQMGKGAQSDAVYALQRSLKICYGKNIATDHIFGNDTKSALYDVQGTIHAGQDGVYGPETFSKIKFAPMTGSNKSQCNRPIPDGSA